MAYVTAPDFAIRTIEWSLDRPAQINVSKWTGRRTVVADPWHGKWRARVELATVQGEENVRALRSFLVRCKGSVNTFRIYATAGSQNSNSGVTVSSAASAGATSLVITGAATALTDGQLFTVNGQLCCCISAQSGGTLVFEPPLRAAAAVGTEVHTSRPYALVHMASAQLGYGIENWRRFGISFDVEEAIMEADAFTPASLFTASQAGAWYDPSDLTSMWQDSAGTIAAAVDSPVGKINDKSGNGNHLLQATSAARPILRLESGYYYLDFDGVDDLLDDAITTMAQPFSRASAIRQVSWTSNDYIFTGATSAAGGLVQLGASPTLKIYAGTAFVADNANLAVGTNGVVTEKFNGASSELIVNSGAATTGNPGATGITNITVGGLTGGGFYSNMRMYGLVVRTGILTAQEYADLKTYLGAKAGLTL